MISFKNVRAKISFKGIIIGAITDVVGSNVWGVVLGFYLAAKYNLTSAISVEQFQALIAQDQIAGISGWVVGGIFSVLGGYVAARIAKHNELLNGTLTSFLCVLFALSAIGSASFFDVVVGVLINPVLAFIGAYIRLKQINAKLVESK